jgi:uncharacterized protein
MHTLEVRKYAKRSILCWLATVDPNGWPSVSPKAVFAVFDSTQIVLAGIASRHAEMPNEYRVWELRG